MIAAAVFAARRSGEGMRVRTLEMAEVLSGEDDAEVLRVDRPGLTAGER